LTILVTGASGLIGSHLCRKLAEEGRYVVGLVHRARNPILRGKVWLSSCDIRDYDAVDSILDHYRPDTVFHFAAHLPSTANPDFIKVNVIGTSNLLDVCYRKGVKNFVYASSMSVYSTSPLEFPVDEEHPTRPDDTYGKTKLIGELLCECYSKVMRTIVIRFSSVFGLGDNSRVAYHFMQSAISGQPIQVDGALDKGKSGEVYNIGSGQETSVLELANLIAGTANPPVEVKLSGKPATRPLRFVADISKARMELGYSSSGLVEGLKKYQDEINDKK